MILDVKDLPSAGSFDLVVSTECLDHCEDWKAAMTGMVTALKPGGILMLTTRSEGFPYHPHPGDYWRFSVEDMKLIASRAGLDVIAAVEDPQDQLPGVFLKAQKPSKWEASDINFEGVTVAEVVK